MKISEFKNKIKNSTVEELNKEYEELKSELFKLRFQQATNRLENPMKIKEIKRNIARIKTELRIREKSGKAVV